VPKAVDLRAVGNALAVIRRTLTEHPEVRERTAASLRVTPTKRRLMVWPRKLKPPPQRAA